MWRFVNRFFEEILIKLLIFKFFKKYYYYLSIYLYVYLFLLLLLLGLQHCFPLRFLKRRDFHSVGGFFLCKTKHKSSTKTFTQRVSNICGRTGYHACLKLLEGRSTCGHDAAFPRPWESSWWESSQNLNGYAGIVLKWTHLFQSYCKHSRGSKLATECELSIQFSKIIGQLRQGQPSSSHKFIIKWRQRLTYTRPFIINTRLHHYRR